MTTYEQQPNAYEAQATELVSATSRLGTLSVENMVDLEFRTACSSEEQAEGRVIFKLAYGGMDCN